MKQIFDCISDGEIIATGKIAKEIGLSEKSVRNRLNELSDFLLQNKLGEIQRKPRVGIWLEANENQKEEIQKILSDENLQVGNYDPRDRVNETLKVFFNLRPWQTMTTQKLAEKLFLSVPTMLKVLKECEEWLAVYHISLVNERGKGYRLKSEENEYRVALKNLIMMKKSGEEIQENIEYFFSTIDVSAIRKCIIQTENEWNYHFTDESFYEILIYCCIAYKRKELALPLVSDYYSEELKILKKYNEYSFTVAIFEKLEEIFHVHFLTEDLFDYIKHEKEIVKKYDNKLVDFVDRMLKVIRDILDVDLTTDQKVKESLIIHLRPTIFRLRYGTQQKNPLIDFIKKEYKNVFRASWAISILFEEYYGLQITEDEIGYIVLYIQAAIERKKHQYRTVMVSNFNMGHIQLVKEKIKKSVPEIEEIKFVSIHDFKIIDYEDYDIIISTEDRKEKDKRIVVIPNILNETGISTLRTYLDSMNSMMIENATPFSPECFILFSPEFIFTDLEVKTKEECIKTMSQALEEKHVVTEEFYDSVMDRESKTTTTIGNGVSLPHGSPTAVNESKVGIAILKNPIMWDNEQVQVVFLLAFRLSTRDEISRIQMFYKEYVTLIDSEEKLQKLKSMKSNIELYKYLIQ